MPHRTGSADLPLHRGHVPPWLASRMAALAAVITEAIVDHYGRAELLRRLSHPFWFQSLGAVMGMDWHSSGVTTSVVGALKRGLASRQDELGIYVCGGRGRHSRQTPTELMQVAEHTGVDGDALARTSRLVAKIDNAAVQDGFDLYLHAFVVTAGGEWCVVQQGMNGDSGLARRYHWLSEGLQSFVDSPHAAIEGPNVGAFVNLADRRAAASRAASLGCVREGPDRTIAVLRRLHAPGPATLDLFPEPAPDTFEPADEPRLPHVQMPVRHGMHASDVVLRRLHGVLAAAAERGPADFTDLLLTPRLGARTVAALALVAEVVHGTACRFSDPARFALAHGGKDGHPFPVALNVYDETLGVLKKAVLQAKLGQREKLAAIERLDVQARRLERTATGPDLKAFITQEREASREYGGRTVFDR